MYLRSAMRARRLRALCTLTPCRAIVADPPGGPEACAVKMVEVPNPDRGQVLIRVRAAGVNRPDCLQRAGGYPAPVGASVALGLEVAGEVVARGECDHGDGWIPELGDNVVALLTGGGYAEYCLASVGCCLPLPEMYLKSRSHHASASDPFVRGAALPETLFTVWKNLFSRVPGSNSIELRAGETLLVHGGSSGIGTMAIQLGRALGVRVLATAGSEAKRRACLDLGAEAAFDYRSGAREGGAPTWVDDVRDVAGKSGVSAVLDMVGGSYLQHNINVLGTGGRLCVIGFLQGPRSEVNMTRVLLKSLRLTGSVLRSQPDTLKAQLRDELQKEVWPLFMRGDVLPVIEEGSVFRGLEYASVAHERMERSEHVGKIVLVVD